MSIYVFSNNQGTTFVLNYLLLSAS